MEVIKGEKERKDEGDKVRPGGTLKDSANCELPPKGSGSITDFDFSPVVGRGKGLSIYEK